MMLHSSHLRSFRRLVVIHQRDSKQKYQQCRKHQHLQIFRSSTIRRKSSITTTNSGTNSLSSSHSNSTHNIIRNNVKTSLSKTKKKKKNILPLHIVESRSVKKSLPYIGHVSYMLLASGFLMTDMLLLRMALVVGYTGLVSFHLLQRKPLRIPLRWSALFVFVNAGATTMLLIDQYGYGKFKNEDDETLYKEHFEKQGLTRGQFDKLMKISSRMDIQNGTVLTIEGQPCHKLYFIEKGEVKMYLHDTFASNLHVGNFVNDVAFQQYDENASLNNGKICGAYGTAVSSGPKTSLIVWDKEELKALLKSKPDMDTNLKYCLTSHLVKALLQQREAAYIRKQKEQQQQQQQQQTISQRQRHGEEQLLILNNNNGDKSGNDKDVTELHAKLQKHKTMIRRSPSEFRILWDEQVDNNKSSQVDTN